MTNEIDEIRFFHGKACVRCGCEVRYRANRRCRDCHIKLMKKVNLTRPVKTPKRGGATYRGKESVPKEIMQSIAIGNSLLSMRWA